MSLISIDSSHPLTQLGELKRSLEYALLECKRFENFYSSLDASKPILEDICLKISNHLGASKQALTKLNH